MKNKTIEAIVAGIFIALLTIIGVMLLLYVIMFMFSGLQSIYHTIF